MLLSRGRRSVGNLISITSQPASQLVADGGSVTFSVAASSRKGSPVAYQWQRSDDSGATWSDLSGETGSSLTVSSVTIASDSGDQYRATVSSAGAPQVASNAATLTVATTPGAPGSISVQSRLQELFVFYSSPSSNGGAAITGYQIEASSDGGTTWQAASGDSVGASIRNIYLEVPGAVNSASYLVRVAAINAIGVGAYATATTPVAKTPVTLTTAAFGGEASTGAASSCGANRGPARLISVGPTNPSSYCTFQPSRSCLVYVCSASDNPSSASGLYVTPPGSSYRYRWGNWFDGPLPSPFPDYLSTQFGDPITFGTEVVEVYLDGDGAVINVAGEDTPKNNYPTVSI